MAMMGYGPGQPNSVVVLGSPANKAATPKPAPPPVWSPHIDPIVGPGPAPGTHMTRSGKTVNGFGMYVPGTQWPLHTNPPTVGPQQVVANPRGTLKLPARAQVPFAAPPAKLRPKAKAAAKKAAPVSAPPPSAPGNPGVNGSAGGSTAANANTNTSTSKPQQITFAQYLQALGLGGGDKTDYGSIAQQMMKPILDAIQGQQGQLDTRRKNDIANAQGFYGAIANILKGQGNDVNQMYQDAGKNQDAFGSGFQAALQAHQTANEGNIDSILQQNGAPDSQIAQVHNQVNGAAPAVLNGLGALPASVFAQEGPAFGKAADGFTNEALGQEQLFNAKTNQQYQADLQQLNNSRMTEMDKIPGLIQSLRTSGQSAQAQRAALMMQAVNGYVSQYGVNPLTGVPTLAGRTAVAKLTGYDPATNRITPAYAKQLQTDGINAQKFKLAARKAATADYRGGLTGAQYTAKKGEVDNAIGTFIKGNAFPDSTNVPPAALRSNPNVTIDASQKDAKGKTIYKVSWAKPPRWESVFMALVQEGYDSSLVYREMRDSGYPGVPAKWQG